MALFFVRSFPIIFGWFFFACAVFVCEPAAYDKEPFQMLDIRAMSLLLGCIATEVIVAVIVGVMMLAQFRALHFAFTCVSEGIFA